MDLGDYQISHKSLEATPVPKMTIVMKTNVFTIRLSLGRMSALEMFRHLKDPEKPCNKETCLRLLNYARPVQTASSTPTLTPSDILLNTSKKTDLEVGTNLPILWVRKITGPKRRAFTPHYTAS